jgi:hypothetical protein
MMEGPQMTLLFAGLLAVVALGASVFLGIVGRGSVMSGRTAHNPVALVAGILLCVFACVVDGPTWTLLSGLILLAAPFLVHV